MSSGRDALGVRLRLIELAQRGIDAQYFLWKPDRAGKLLLSKLLLAADRGVRVRLLLDDIFTPNFDDEMVLLASHPNIDIRLFNPLQRGVFKYPGYLADFKRANRRMHNKSFTVDNNVTIIGGRNIGEEYFDLKTAGTFDDFEMLAVGPVVEQTSASFDAFWNSRLAVPIAAIGSAGDTARVEQWRAAMREEVAPGASGLYAQAHASTMLREIREGQVTLTAAPATLVSDLPQKLKSNPADVAHRTMATEIGRHMLAAQRELLVVTPYFIPLESGAANIEALLARGVRVVIVTNSLASTNHVPVHSAYVRYRKRLLEAGAEIYEIAAATDGEASDWGHSRERLTLHTKAAVIDRTTLIVGSMNFDPRSIQLNSELGLMIRSPLLATDFAGEVGNTVSSAAYRVELDERNKLRWVYLGDGEQYTVSREPQAGFGRRFMAGFYRLLPLEDQL
ncbi:phospholipase D family protein [Mangrovimicrobium sediminis]|uniref:phospholipase D family protein n=1 Tax=Mangrovimicrobium sediminis TaxID=2562682 RepID=UPI001436AB10|nr:phospholipase D family protein [Haliea sp. SAOS-164]